MRIEPSTCTLEVAKSGALTYYAMGATICTAHTCTLLDPLLVINYWEKNQCEEEGDEAPMSIFQVAADYYCGDLCFV